MELLSNGDVAANGPMEDGKEGLGAGLAQLMDELAHGVLVTTMEGRLLHANHAARHELARRRVLGARNNLVYTCVPEEAVILRDAIARVAEGRRSLVTISNGEGATLTVAVLPIKAEGIGQPARAALVFARASVCESLMLCFFARSHGLTPTEEQVLRILCDGHSAPVIATQLNVQVSTIRSHIRSLCAKTRSSGVRELVNRVAVLPPVAPAFWHEPMH
jgi:DNA-binding CsgD family transcriptional regulator